MVNVGFVTNDHVEYFQTMLQESEVSVNGTQEGLSNYMSFIHSLEPKAKGVDLGICVIIIDGLHGARFLDEEGFANLDDVRTIFTEAVERCLAHTLYNKQIHSFDFINGNDDIEILRPNLIQACIDICKIALETGREVKALEVGIKYIEFLGEQILD